MSTLDEFLDESQQLLVAEVRAKYSAQVVDHWLNPRNPRTMHDPDGHARREGDCGDVLEIFLKTKDDRIVDASFVTDGCITSIVSGSMAVELALQSRLPDVLAVTAEEILEGLGGLPEESEHCADLAARTLRAAAAACAADRTEPWKKLYRK